MAGIHNSKILKKHEFKSFKLKLVILMYVIDENAAI